MSLPFPDLRARTQATGEHAGYDWEVVANGLGYLCGYVKVGPGHPWFRKAYEAIDADVHGGLTFAAAGNAEAEWWVGFDCAHAGDLMDLKYVDDPGTRAYFEKGSASVLLRRVGCTVKDIDYVKNECERLTDQAYKAEHA